MEQKDTIFGDEGHNCLVKKVKTVGVICNLVASTLLDTLFVGLSHFAAIFIVSG
jgi:hypothetical protein